MAMPTVSMSGASLSKAAKGTTTKESVGITAILARLNLEHGIAKYLKALYASVAAHGAAVSA